MSIQPPDPNIIQANLSAQSAMNPFTMREQAHYNHPDTMQVEYGIGDDAYQGALGAMNPGYGPGQPAVNNPFAAVPIASSRGEFYEAVAIFASESNAYLDPDDTSLYPSQGPSQGYFYNNNAASPAPWTGPRQTTGSPASLTEVPTSTMFPERPRTIAAGYDKARQCLTVVFRDGTYYNYYEVDGRTWQNFKRAKSKGRFILTYLDSHPRGVANVSSLPSSAREALYRISRTGQIKRSGVTGNQKAGSKRGGRGSYKSGNLGGTGRARQKKANP